MTSNQLKRLNQKHIFFLNNLFLILILKIEYLHQTMLKTMNLILSPIEDEKFKQFFLHL